MEIALEAGSEFKPIDFEDYTFLLSECIEYVEQLVRRARTPDEDLSVEERDASPVIAFVGLVRTYRKAAPSSDYFNEQLAAFSEPGANVERFAGISAASYHGVAIEIVRELLAAVAEVLEIRLIDSMKPCKDGGYDGYQVFLPDLEQLPVDHPRCMKRLAELPEFDDARLQAFLRKEASRFRSLAGSGTRNRDHNGTRKDKSGLSTLADCAYRFDKLCRSDPLRAEARRLVAEFQAAHDEHSKGESDWEKQRRVYFEEAAMADDELLDDASHYQESDLHWQSYQREVRRGEVEDIPSKVRASYFNPLPEYYPETPMLSPERQKAGTIEITAWAPVEYMDCNNPKPAWPLPPKNIGRAYRLEEIVAALVAIHDMDGRFEPIVPEDDPIHKHWLFDVMVKGIVGSSGNDEWASALEPLLERVETEWLKRGESDKNVGNFDDRRGDGKDDDTARELAELSDWASKILKGKQRRVIELITKAGGTTPISDLASDEAIAWEKPYDNAWNSIRKELNSKLKKAPGRWQLSTHDGKAELSTIGQK